MLADEIKLVLIVLQHHPYHLAGLEQGSRMVFSVAFLPITLSGNTRSPCTRVLTRVIPQLILFTSDVTSEESLITFNVYDRSVEDQGFLGTVQIKPILIHDHTVDQWYK